MLALIKTLPNDISQVPDIVNQLMYAAITDSNFYPDLVTALCGRPCGRPIRPGILPAVSLSAYILVSITLNAPTCINLCLPIHK